MVKPRLAPGDERFVDHFPFGTIGKASTNDPSPDWSLGWKASAVGEPLDELGVSDARRAGHRDYHRLSNTLRW